MEMLRTIHTAPPEPLLDVCLREPAAGELTVGLTGELDIASAELLTAVFRSRPCPALVRLEVGALTFVDCAGLRALEVIQDRVIAAAGSLVLLHVNPRLQWLLRTAGLDHRFATDPALHAREGSRTCTDRPY